MQDLSGQLRDLAVPFGILNEPGNIGAGVFQFLKPYFHGRELFLDIFLLSGVLLRQDAILLVRDASKYTVLVEPFEQLRQLGLALLHGVDLLLEHSDLLLCLLALLLADMLRKPQLILTSEVRDTAYVIQQDSIEFLFPDVMSGADVFAFLLVGGAHKVVFHRIHGVRPVQYHGASTVQAVDQSRKDILLSHIGSAPFVLADILYDLPGLLCNQCLVRILKAELLSLRTLNALLVFEGQGGGFQVDGVTQVSLILQNASDGVGGPVVWLSDVYSGQFHPMLLVVGISRRGNSVFLELLCNLGRTLSRNAEVKDVPHYRSSLRIRHHVSFGICRVLHISIAGSGGHSGASLSLETNHRASLLAAVFGIELVHQIPEGREVIGGLVQAVHAVVDGDKAHTIAWEDEFRVLTHLKVLAAQSGHILDDQCFHLTVFHQLHDLLPAWTVEIRSRVTVVIQEEGVGESFLSCILLQQKFLRRDLSRYVFVKKCAIRIDKKQKERYGKKYCHHSPSIEESLLQDAVMRAIMQTAKQNVEVLKTLKIHIGMGLTDEVTEDKTLDIQIRIAEINTEFQKLLKAVSADNADGIDEERITELMNEKQRLTVQLEQYAAMRQKRESAKSRLDEIYTILDGLQNHPMEYNDKLVRQIIECIVVESKEKIKVVFIGGTEIEMTL